MRRVVTGQLENGKSVIVSDEIVAWAGSANSTTVAMLWGADTPPRFPQDGKMPAFEVLFPGPGGYRFITSSIPPNTVSAPSPQERQIAPDIAKYMEEAVPGMHTTDTVDLGIILSGEAVQEFDDGAIVHLKAGDCFIQNGTRHRWSNPGSVPTIVLTVIIGGHARTR
jgi:mannose-6-phosphate isomerase-like protein (cupin superfamily)